MTGLKSQVDEMGRRLAALYPSYDEALNGLADLGRVLREGDSLDPLEAEFRALERDVLQRNCPHATVVDVTEMGEAGRYVCGACGADRPPYLSVQPTYLSRPGA